MINKILGLGVDEGLIFGVVMASFIITLIAITVFKKIMPTDNGRAFAVNGKLSQGKPRGVGAVFITVFVIMTVCFLPVNLEFSGYMVLVMLTMLSGYLDDRSDVPWNEYKKGLIDLLIAVSTSAIFVCAENNWGLRITDTIKLNTVLSFVISIGVIWVAINVTNCSDGVDGLCGTLSIVTLLTCVAIMQWSTPVYSAATLMLVSCILGYLWYNVSPSSLLMGDAGSRALGYFIALICLNFMPVYLCFFVAAVIIADGGIGLVKVVLLRFFKIHVLKNVRTPLHDYVRKDKGWSDGQVVFRFALIQIIVSVSTVFYLWSCG